MDLGTGIAIVGISIPGAALGITFIRSRTNGHSETCPLHSTLTEDIREIKDDVKALIKEVASFSGRK